MLGHVVGAVEDIPAMIQSTGADRIVVSLSDARGKLPMDQLLDIRLRTNVTFDHLASAYEEYTGKIALETLRPSWFVFSSGFRKTSLLLTGKRALDLALALVVLVVTAPFLLAAAALVKLTSPGGAIYSQDRVGLNGRVFRIYKLRTMRADAEAVTGPIWSALNDPRITPVGRFLRKTRLDELPQLWNVLRGDMSFIGPRPERPQFVTDLSAAIPFFSQRHVLKPGITGWAQVNHAYAASVEDAVEKLQYQPVLHQESLVLAGRVDPGGNGEDRDPAPRCPVMCGIAGIFNFAASPTDDRVVARRMRDAMTHRGPDDSGLYQSPDRRVVLAHRRLSIVDLSAAGHQPMTNEDGTIWITFNGEIYNQLERRAGLLARGHVFKSRSDTEVIVHAYEEAGPDCVPSLDGMFAFALWDARRRRAAARARSARQEAPVLHDRWRTTRVRLGDQGDPRTSRCPARHRSDRRSIPF